MSWLSGLFGKQKREKELEEEVRSHLEMAVRERTERGEKKEEAEHAARREFGNVELVKEVTRDAWGWKWLGDVAADTRFGLRMLLKNPGFTAVAVLTLALGMGANAAIFTVINAVMLRALPVQHPEELVVVGDPARIYSWGTGTPRTDVFSYPLYCEVRDHNDVFSSLLASANLGNLQIAMEAGLETVRGRLVSENYFQTLGVEALLGRTFTADESRTPGGDPVVIISYGYW